MKILWLTWKDHRHPGWGGAEVVLRELSQRLVHDGHDVTWLTCSYPGAAAHEQVDGINIIRVGSNRYAHSFQALAYYVRHLRGQFDIIIEVVNTAPYFSVFFAGGAKKFLLYHQLAREIWFHETKPPLSHFGFSVLEPMACRLLSWAGAPAITVSESTRRDIARFGFRPERTSVISEGIEIEPVANLQSTKKYQRPTLLSFGAVRSMKRTLDQVAAFELAKKHIPRLQLKVAGDISGTYGQKVLDRITHSPFARDIEVLGRVSKADKITIMRRAHLTMQTALKEGWGLTITEAASQGTPAVAYDVDGLRDSIRAGQTGMLTPANPEALSRAIVKLLKDRKLYKRMREAAWRWSQQLTFDQSYQDFKTVLELA